MRLTYSPLVKRRAVLLMKHRSNITTLTKMYVEVNSQKAKENKTWLQYLESD